MVQWPEMIREIRGASWQTALMDTGTVDVGEAVAESPLLDSIHQLVANSSWCPSPVQADVWEWINCETGELRNGMRCRRNGCPYCVRVNASRRALAIAWAEPERALTVTGLGDGADDPWPHIRLQMKRIRDYAARAGSEMGEWVWHVERNPAGTGHHAHVWQSGGKVDIDALRAASRRAGAGSWLHVSRIRSSAGAAQYGLKGLGYGMKGVTDSGSDYLALNGSRLTHQSRGFFRGLPVRRAEVESLASLGTCESPWVLRNRRSA